MGSSRLFLVEQSELDNKKFNLPNTISRVLWHIQFITMWFVLNPWFIQFYSSQKSWNDFGIANWFETQFLIPEKVYNSHNVVISTALQFQ